MSTRQQQRRRRPTRSRRPLPPSSAHDKAKPSIARRAGRLSTRTWALVVAPTITVVAGATAKEVVVPLLHDNAPRADLVEVSRQQDATLGASGTLADPRSVRRFRDVLGCSGRVYDVKLTTRGFPDDRGPFLQWMLIDHATRHPAATAKPLQPLRAVAAPARGGIVPVWVAYPDETGRWEVHFTVYANARDIPGPGLDSAVARVGMRTVETRIPTPHCHL
jgi:hypothetical protein